ncbi:MAG: AraC family transcriptional regulator [Pseudomonadota bacterium]
MTAPGDIRGSTGITPFLDVKDWAEVSAVSDDGQLATLDRPGVSAGRFALGAHSSAIAAADQIVLVTSTHASGELRADINGSRTHKAIQSGAVSMIPSGVTQQYVWDGTLTNTFVTIDQALIDAVTANDPHLQAVRGLEPRIGLHHRGLKRSIEELFQVMTRADLGWRTLSEAIAIRVAYEVLVAFGPQQKEDGPHPLGAAELDRVVAFIEAELERNFTVGEMAQLLDRDPFGFIRSFKATTGESPHQFVIQRRLSRAQEMLTQTSDSLAEIAFATGFASQSHMTATFTRLVGMPPGKWRRHI